MKFSTFACSTISTLSFFSRPIGAAESCTHGKLFISDAGSASVHVFDADSLVSSANGASVSSEHTISIPQGQAGLNLKATGNGRDVVVSFRGTEDIGYTDGTVTFVDTGLTIDAHDDHYHFEFGVPTEFTNAAFDCARPIHITPHDDKIALFCDGNFGLTAQDQVNSTVWVVDESKFSTEAGAESAIVFSTTLAGSHHGAAVPVDDDHVLYSLATQDRIDRTEIGSLRGGSLPETFIVTDYQGNVIHEITDINNTDTSCSGFHGEWADSNQFALACDADHGGILRVDYDATTQAYTSRSLSYPESFAGHRTGTFAGHSETGIIVANFAGGPPEAPQAHLVAFDPMADAITDDQVLTLPMSQCSFAYEKGAEEMVLVMLPNGDFHVFEFHNGAWEQLAQITVLEGGVEACGDMSFVPGVQQAFVIHKANQEIHAIDMTHVEEGELKVTTTAVDFVPFDAVVSGAPKEIACVGGGHDDHDHDHDHHDDHDHSDEQPSNNNVVGNNAADGARGDCWKEGAAVFTVGVAIMITQMIIL